MAWDLDSDRPIYLQLVERIQMQIVSGAYEPGGKLPSVREYAAEAAVNPNTMQKAFSELERSGLIITQRTNGRVVTDDVELIRKIRDELAQEQAEVFLRKMAELGLSREEAIGVLRQIGGADNE
ncbi:MAG: GntR family transcriptional regulator [Acetatifactor sp.]|nr:GntR family transcriptional regulator [Acetatifactor sp.]